MKRVALVIAGLCWLVIQIGRAKVVWDDRSFIENGTWWAIVESAFAVWILSVIVQILWGAVP